MKSIDKVTCCVVDTGLFFNFARRMASACDRVLIWNPECRAFPSLRQGALGDGFPNIERVSSPWLHLEDIDLFCFPDVGLGPLQLHLSDIGKAVWGARMGESLELNREGFLRVLEHVGLDVPDYHICEGIHALREWLEDREDQYVKISRYRGDMETHHWRNALQDSAWLDSLAVSLGPIAAKVRFLVFPAIHTDLEIGGDTYSVDGQWPDLMLNGIEGKDKSYFSAVTRRQDMPDQVQSVMDAFGPILRQYHYRQQWSSEIRVDGDKAYFIDATCRGGMPSSGSQHLLWKNFPEIVWAGANGELVNPEPVARFSIETMITAKREEGTWEVVPLPKELEGVALMNTCCMVDGVYCFPPSEFGSSDVGWLVSIGDDPKKLVEDQKKAADLLPDGLNADVEALADVIKEIEVAKDEGIRFTDATMPKPESVL